MTTLIALFALVSGGTAFWAWKRLTPRLPTYAHSIDVEIATLFAQPVAAYSMDPQSEGSRVKTEEHMPDENAEKAIIRLQERYSSQEQQLQRLERLIGDGQRQSTEALEKLATAFNTAFQKASAEYVTKQEFQTVKNIVNGAAAAILLGFLGFLIAQAWPK